MKTKETVKLAGLLAAIFVAAQGCVFFAAGAGAGAGVGVITYFENELRVTREVSLDAAWDAANLAMKDMEFIVIPGETHKDATGGIVQGRTAKDETVRVELLRQSDRITEIRIRVGIFMTTEHRTAEQLYYEKLSKHLPMVPAMPGK